MTMSNISDELCRDFEKGDCRRGSRCKFFHPKLRICKDFQNKKCERESCRFLHVSRDEEEKYDQSGILPEHLDDAEARRNRIMTPFGTALGNGVLAELAGYGKRRRDNGFNMIPAAIPTVLVQENELLKQKVAELQRQVTDLRQMNDTLYEQNTEYRNQLRGVTTTAHQALTNSHQALSIKQLTAIGINDMVANGTY